MGRVGATTFKPASAHRILTEEASRTACSAEIINLLSLECKGANLLKLPRLVVPCAPFPSSFLSLLLPSRRNAIQHGHSPACYWILRFRDSPSVASFFGYSMNFFLVRRDIGIRADGVAAATAAGSLSTPIRLLSSHALGRGRGSSPGAWPCARRRGVEWSRGVWSHPTGRAASVIYGLRTAVFALLKSC